MQRHGLLLMRNVLAVVKKPSFLLKLLPLLAFAVPLFWLYTLEPASFEAMWKGRTFQLFFIWLIGLELILDWENLQTNKIVKIFSARTAAFAAVLVLPTVYVAASYNWGLNSAIFNWASQSHIQWASSMPLSTEYLAFAVLFGLMVFLAFGFKGLKTFSVPLFFLSLVGTIYTIDNVFPYGQFTPFQIFVPTTTTLAAAILNLMGYTTSITYGQSSLEGRMPILTATDPHSFASASYSIAWPCAGIESFLIFTVVTLLFLKRMSISLRGKVGFFIFGAAVTYVINAFRIVEIFRIGISNGNIDMFHFYYGPLPAVIWIVLYPLVVLVSLNLWHKARKPREQSIRPQSVSPSPA